MTKEDLEECLSKIKIRKGFVVTAKTLRCYRCRPIDRKDCEDYLPLTIIKNNVERELAKKPHWRADDPDYIEGDEEWTGA